MTRAQFLQLLIDKGVTLLEGPSTLPAELEALADRLGDRRLAMVARKLHAAIVADEPLVTEVKHLAAQQGKTMTEVIQEALREYVRTHQVARDLSFAGIGRGGQPDTAERDEQHLAAEVSPTKGWSPRRRPDRSVETESASGGS